MNANLMRDISAANDGREILNLDTILLQIREAALRGDRSFRLPICRPVAGPRFPFDLVKWEPEMHGNLEKVIFGLLDLGFSVDRTETVEYTPQDNGTARLEYTVRW